MAATSLFERIIMTARNGLQVIAVQLLPLVSASAIMGSLVTVRSTG
jgi:hypothetical protein